MVEFIEDICTKFHLDQTCRTYLAQHLELHFMSKGREIVKQGAVNRSLYFIKSGIWRTYVIHHGEEITLWISLSGDYELSPWGYLKGAPSRYNISTSTSCEVIEIKHEVIQHLSQQSPQFACYMSQLFAELVLKTDEMLIALSSPQAIDRYLALVKQKPELVLMAPQKELARFLGITPQSLSRIRAQLKHRSQHAE